MNAPEEQSYHFVACWPVDFQHVAMSEDLYALACTCLLWLAIMAHICHGALCRDTVETHLCKVKFWSHPLHLQIGQMPKRLCTQSVWHMQCFPCPCCLAAQISNIRDLLANACHSAPICFIWAVLLGVPGCILVHCIGDKDDNYV